MVNDLRMSNCFGAEDNLTKVKDGTYLGIQFTLKILSKPSSMLGSTNRDLDYKHNKGMSCLLINHLYWLNSGSLIFVWVGSVSSRNMLLCLKEM